MGFPFPLYFDLLGRKNRLSPRAEGDESPAAQAAWLGALQACRTQQRAPRMSCSSRSFQALPSWLIEGISEQMGNVLKSEHEEAAEGFSRGHRPDQ